MDNKEFGKNLEKRTKEFAIAIFRLSAILPNSPEYKVLRNQITKSGSSIGANYREANRSRSQADFKNRIRICEAEASETLYWLEIISELTDSDKALTEACSKEAAELLALFTSIGKKLNT